MNEKSKNKGGGTRSAKVFFAEDFLAHCLDGIGVVTTDGVIKYANPALERMCGYSREDASTVHEWIKLVFPDTAARRQVLREWREDSRSANPPERIHQITRKDGALRWCRFQVVHKTNGEVVVNGRDITEQQSVQQALKESEKTFRALAEQSPNMIFINHAGRIVYANKKCEEVTGYARDELYSERFNFMDLVAPEYHAKTRSNFRKHMHGIEVAPFEYVIVSKKGKRIDAWIATRLISYNGGRAILGIVADISRLKQTQTKLSQSQKELREQKKELEEKNAAMRHVLAQIETEKREITDRISANIERLLMPAILKLRKQATSIERRHLDLLKRNVEQLTSQFGLRMGQTPASLSPRETEICDMIRNGLPSKEIADLLHISLLTIHTLRNRIRQKLGLRRKGVNLTSYLQSLSSGANESSRGLRTDRR